MSEVSEAAKQTLADLIKAQEEVIHALKSERDAYKSEAKSHLEALGVLTEKRNALESENARLSGLAAEWKAEADALRVQLEKQKAVVEGYRMAHPLISAASSVLTNEARRIFAEADNALASLDAGEKGK